MASTIVLKGGLDGTRNQEGKAGEIFSPGHAIVRSTSTDRVLLKQSVLGSGVGEVFFAKEDSFRGKTIDDAFAVDDWVLGHRPNKGDVINARIASGVNATREALMAYAGDGTLTPLLIRRGGLYQNTAASANITNTNSETAFDKSYTLPAKSLRAGDKIKISARVTAPTTNGTDTLTLKVKIGSTVLLATSAVDVADNDVGQLEVDLTFRTVGASGTMVADGKWALGVPDTATWRDDGGLTSTSVDTTAALAITVTATWSAASASDIVRLDNLSVSLVRTVDDVPVAQVYGAGVDNTSGLTEAFCPVKILD